MIAAGVDTALTFVLCGRRGQRLARLQIAVDTSGSYIVAVWSLLDFILNGQRWQLGKHARKQWERDRRLAAHGDAAATDRLRCGVAARSRRLPVARGSRGRRPQCGQNGAGLLAPGVEGGARDPTDAADRGDQAIGAFMGQQRADPGHALGGGASGGARMAQGSLLVTPPHCQLHSRPADPCPRQRNHRLSRGVALRQCPPAERPRRVRPAACPPRRRCRGQRDCRPRLAPRHRQRLQLSPAARVAFQGGSVGRGCPGGCERRRIIVGCTTGSAGCAWPGT